MSSLSEGSPEIAGARLRLDAAKAQASAASKNMESVKAAASKNIASAQDMTKSAKSMTANAEAMRKKAKVMMESAISMQKSAVAMTAMANSNMEAAKLQVVISQKEVKEAEAILKDAEKRWENININPSIRVKEEEVYGAETDDEDCRVTSNTDAEGSNKRRKVSLSPQGLGNNNNDGNSAASVAVGQKNSSGNGDSSSDNNAGQFVVEGCSIPRCNGTYNRAVGVIHAGAPVYAQRDNFLEEGVKNCVIYRDVYKTSYLNQPSSITHVWCIGLWYSGRPTTQHGRPDIINYHDDHFTTPPETNWPHGIKCRPVKNIERRSIVAPYQDQIVVEGCGTTELNGIYKLSDMHDGAPEYTRKGDWKGREVTYAIFREYPHITKRSHTNSWCIGRSTVTGGNVYNMTMFKSEHNANCMIPPESGWSIVGRTRGGVSPAPKCRPNNSGRHVVPENDGGAISLGHPPARLGRQHDERDREQRRQQQGSAPKKQVATRAVLSKENTDALYAKIKRLVKMWADKEQMKGKSIFYWNIMSNRKMAEVASKAPTTMEELAQCELSQHFLEKYGERLIESVTAFL